MQQIVNVTIDSKGNAIPDSKSIGLQYETGVTRYAITPDPSWVSDQYFYYIIVSPPEDSDNKQYAVPLVNQGGTFIFEISSGITWHVGNYKFAFLTMSKELVDGQVSKDGIVSISESWNGKITKSILDYIALQKQPVDANFQLLYTDLMALSVEVRKQINYAQEQGDYAQEQGNYAKTKTDELITQAQYAQEQGNYAKGQGDNAKAQGNKAQEQGIYAEEQGDYAKKTAEQILQDKENGVFKGDKGDKGDKGEDGLTPYIGENNNWWVGGTDTGVSGSGIVLKASEDNIIDFNTITKAGMYFIENVTRDTALNVPGMFSFVYPSTIPVLVVDRGSNDNRHIITQISAINSGMDYIYTRRMIKNENGSVGAYAWERLNSDINNQIYELSNTVTAKEQALQGQIDRLRANQVQGSASGTEIVVQDAAEMESVLRVSGNSEQDTRSGKNLLKKYSNSGSLIANGVTIAQNSDGTFTLNGTASTNIWFEFVYDFKVNTDVQSSYAFELDSTKQYTGSMQKISGSVTGTIKTNIETTLDGSSKITLELDASQTVTGVNGVTRGFLSISPNTVFNNLVVGVQLEEGSTATSYEPYGVQPSPDYPSEIKSVSGDVEVKVEGKNLLDVNTEILNLYCDANIKKFILSTHYRSIVLEVEPNATYTLSRQTGYGNDFSWTTSKEYPVVGGDVTNFKTNWGSDRLVTTATTGSEDKYLLLYFAYDGTDEVCRGYLSQTQIERGEVQTPYVPYVEPTIVPVPLGDIELRSTPDGTRDTFARVDGKWNKLNKIDSDIFTDQSNIGTYKAIDASEEYIGFNLPTSKKHSAGGNKSQNIISNRFIASGAVYNLNTEAIWAPDATQHTWLSIKKSRLADTTDFTKAVASLKTWLATNPIQTDYVLATPTYTPITDQALIQALDELEQLILHKGYNYITATSVNGVKAQLDLSYIKDINTVLNNITAMIATIGGELNV